ncbi:Uncharacterised protein [Mycobacteroides abscessus subsp. abscessus]|nr:Uncharacterised protein [Mycobacteroides abscessus subsp. abscessus]
MTSIRMVSVRAPSAVPVPYLRCCSSVRFSRWSLPTSRNTLPGWSAGRSPAGIAWTVLPWVRCQNGVPTMNTR